MTARTSRGYAPTVIGGVIAGGVTFFAASRTWASVTVRIDGMPTDRVTVDGAQAVPAVSAMALVVLAASIAVLAASPRVRLLVGAVMTAAAVTAVVLVSTAASALESTVSERIGESPSMTGSGGAQSALAANADPTAWRWVCLGSAVLCVVAGVSVLWNGRGWPTMGRRYESPARSAEPEQDPWKALDRGEDPTV